MIGFPLLYSVQSNHQAQPAEGRAALGTRTSPFPNTDPSIPDSCSDAEDHTVFAVIYYLFETPIFIFVLYKQGYGDCCDLLSIVLTALSDLSLIEEIVLQSDLGGRRKDGRLKKVSHEWYFI